MTNPDKIPNRPSTGWRPWAVWAASVLNGHPVSRVRPLEDRVLRRALPQTHGPAGDQQCPYSFVASDAVPGSRAAGHSVSGALGQSRWPGQHAPWCWRLQGTWGPLGPYVHHPQGTADPEKHVFAKSQVCLGYSRQPLSLTRLPSGNASESQGPSEGSRCQTGKIGSLPSTGEGQALVTPCLTTCSWHRNKSSYSQETSTPVK